MSATPTPGTKSWTPALARRLEAACTPFEEAWKAAAQTPDQRPRIETYLKEFAKEELAQAIEQLLVIDLDYRSKHDEKPAIIADYLSRFPEHKALIQRVSDELATSQSAAQEAAPPTRNGPPGTLSHPPGTPNVPDEKWPTIPGYELIDILGKGGMGVVFKAWQQRPRRLVALKMMRDGGLADPTQLGRFRLEAEAIAHLQHPLIVQVYEVGEFKGQHYFSLEFAEGGTLAQQLHGTPRPPRDAAVLIELLALAVNYAHKHGIVHRDLKPSNVLLTADNQPKITDFGLAKRTYALGEPVSESLETQTGAVLGTPSYMAPEQAAGVKGLTKAVDVYGLGAILYELLTGRPPFRAATPMQTVDQVLHEEPVPPRRLNNQVPRDLEVICLECLHKEPGRRYKTAAALAEDLHRFLAGETIKARPAGMWERGVKWARRRPTAAALVGVGLAAVVFLFGTVLWFNDKFRKDLKIAQAEISEEIRLKDVLRNESAVKEHCFNAERLLATAKLSADPVIVTDTLAKARTKLEAALVVIGGEERLEHLQPGTRNLLDQVNAAEKLMAAVRKADATYKNIIQWRDEALYRAGFCLFGDAGPAYRAAVEEAAHNAIELLHPKPVDLTPEFIATLPLVGYTEEQKVEIRAGCHELRLVLADGTPPAEKSPRTKALHHCQLGIEQLRIDQPSQAIKSFDKALDEWPGYFWAQYLLAVAYLRLDSSQPAVRTANAQTALANLRACLPAHPSPLVYLVSGVAHGHLKDYPAAERDFKIALDSKPDSGTEYGIYVNRGLVRIMGQDLRGGIDDLVRARGLDPNRAAAYVNLARAYEEVGRAAKDRSATVPAPPLAPALAEAERVFWLLQAGEQLDLAIGHNPQQPDLYRFRAHLHRECAEPEAALGAIETAICLAWPHNAEDYAESGRILFDLGNYADSCKALSQASNLAGSPATWLGLGYAWWRLADSEPDDGRKRKQYEAAVEAFGHYLWSPEGVSDGRVHASCGLLCLLKLQAYDAALNHLKVALKTPDAQLYTARGQAHLALNHLGAALSDFNETLQTEPNNPHALNGRGLARVKSAQDARAVADGVADANRALESVPWTPEQVYDAARVFAQALRPSMIRQLSTLVRDGYERRAVSLLGEVVYSFKTARARRTFWQNQVLNDPDLVPLRESQDFKKLQDKLFSANLASQ